jgi:hypothetical protein
MAYRTVSEPEFYECVNRRVREMLFCEVIQDKERPRCVTGPGRSGAVAAVYASHILGIPFIPYRQKVPDKLHPVLVIDTARWTGATIRKATRLYGSDAIMLVCYHEPPMVRFWYESRAVR